MTTKYFNTKLIETIEDVKEQYHTLAMQHHPDHGGDVATMQAINAEYQELAKKYANKHRTKTERSEKADVYDIVTEQIIELLEEGVCPWKQPWNSACNMSFPSNFVSKNRYSGLNVLILLTKQAKHNFTSAKWGTFRQISEKGGKVRKGEKGTIITFWKMWNTGKKEINPLTGKEEDVEVPMLRYYKVWNLSQTEGLDKYMEEAQTIETYNNDPIERAEEIQLAMQNRPTVIIGSEDAAYSPSRDEVRVPSLDRYAEPAEYYSTLFHELTHSTGHESRLNRKEEVKSYGLEELVAEIGSAFLCNEAGILPKTVNLSASYLQGWIDALKGDKKLIVRAASQAQRAADYILNTAAKKNNKKNETKTTTRNTKPMQIGDKPSNAPAPAIITKPVKATQGSLLDLLAA